MRIFSVLRVQKHMYPPTNLSFLKNSYKSMKRNMYKMGGEGAKL